MNSLTKPAILLAICLLSSPSSTFAQATATPTQEKISSKTHVSQIESLIKKYQEYNQFNGAVLVAKNDEVILRQGFGLANMEWNIPVKPNTKFRIGSVTKQFTAALILQLVEDGKVKLDEPMTTYLPDYRKDVGDKVTVHQLLNHTSGIPSYTNESFFANNSKTSYKVDEFVKKFCSEDLEFEPGTQMSYNNSGYHLLGAIIESVTGKSYAEVLAEKILQPAGMSNSGFDNSEKVLENRASGYRVTPDGFQNAPYLDMGIPYSAGSMYSTVDDLFKWHQALYDTTLLSETSKALMFEPGKQEYGYGVFIKDRKIGDETVKIIQHGGGIHGFNCLFTRVVDQKHLVVILDNIESGNHHPKMTQAIVNILNDQPFEQAKKSLHRIVDKLALENGATAAVAKYKSLKKESPEIYDFEDERHLNKLGYELLSQDKTDDAIEIFKLNVEMFPEAANPYDSLGEAYLKAENKKLALENYKKSFELDPENMGAAQAIKVIEGKAKKLDPAILQSYVGDYELRPGFTVAISVEDGFLKGQPTGQEKITMAHVSEDKFSVAAVKATVTFERDESGKVKGLVLDQAGQTISGKKTK